MGTMRRYRPGTDLPEDLVTDLRRYAEANGTSSSELLFHWLTIATRLAHQGRGHLLPQVGIVYGRRRAPDGDLGPHQELRWLQGREGYERSRALLESAGSTVPAVFRAAGEAYRAAGGDEVTMEWPPEDVPASAQPTSASSANGQEHEPCSASG